MVLSTRLIGLSVPLKVYGIRHEVTGKNRPTRVYRGIPQVHEGRLYFAAQLSDIPRSQPHYPQVLP